MRSSFAAAALIFAVGGCASSFDLTLMPRGSGERYSGTLAGSGGTGEATVTIDGRTYRGPAVRTRDGSATAVMTTVVPGRAPATSIGSVSAGDAAVRALLSSADGKGLRCDFIGSSSGGSGTCTDDSGKIYDVIIRRK